MSGCCRFLTLVTAWHSQPSNWYLGKPAYWSKLVVSASFFQCTFCWLMLHMASMDCTAAAMSLGYTSQAMTHEHLTAMGNCKLCTSVLRT